jgi:hypothetical protein
MAVHVNNPADMPGRVVIKFQTQTECEQALRSVEYWLKFDSFKIQGGCYESKKVDQKTLQGLRPA